MTREQAKQNLIAVGIEEPTDEQVTSYLNQVNGEAQKEKQKANTYREKAEKFDESQKELEEERKKNMTAEEQLAEAKRLADEKESEYAKKVNRLDVEKILVEAGLSEDDYKDFIDGIVSSDAETSKTLATSLAATFSKQKETIEQMSKEKGMDNTPGSGGKGAEEDDFETEAEKVAKSIADSQKESSDTTKSVLETYL